MASCSLSSSLYQPTSSLSKGRSLINRGVRVPSLTCKKASVSSRSYRVSVYNNTQQLSKLDEKIAEARSLPPSMREDAFLEASTTVLSTLNEMKESGSLSKFASKAELERRSVFPRELTTAGIQNYESIGQPSVRNDAAFLGTVVLSTSLGAVIAGAILPGDWGFFVPYLMGGISLAVLAIGSTAPGLLYFATDKMSAIFPDYRERTLGHEAGHFLVAYLCGVPITGYSLDMGKEHTDLLEAKLQRKMMEGKLEASEVDLLAVVAMAGVSAEGMANEEVVGQNADLMTLQRILNRATDKLNANAQQNITRWAAWASANMIKEHQAEYEALKAAMKDRKSVSECIMAIESA